MLAIVYHTVSVSRANMRRNARLTPSNSKYGNYRAAVEASAATWFARRGNRTETARPYVLASRNCWRENIILDGVYSDIEAVRPRHTMIHHGLSSQALAFNLFGPLRIRDDWEAARSAFVAAGVHWPSPSCCGKFEYNDPMVLAEDRKNQPTSWDLILGPSEDAPTVLVEVKFVEHGLGACSVFSRGDCTGANPANDFDSCYLHFQKKRHYWPIFLGLGLLSTPAFAGAICPLTIYYQFFREVAFAATQGGRMVYVADERNPALFGSAVGHQRGLIPSLLAILPPNLRSQLSVIPIPHILSAIEDSGRHDDWIGEFRRKYRFERGAA
jgi:POLQ-like helicase